MKSPSAFSSKEKAGKKNLTPAIAAVFQGPLRPKKQAWFFFLEIIAGQEKRTKKETLEKNRLNKTRKKNLSEEIALVTHLLDKGIDRRCGNVKGLWLLPDGNIREQHPPSLRVRSLSLSCLAVSGQN